MTAAERDASRRRSSLRRLAGDTAIVIAIALALALLLEAGLRLAGRLRTGSWPSTTRATVEEQIHRALALYRRHPYLNTAPNEGASAEAFGRQASFSARGYRSPDRPPRAAPGVRRVLFSGGSTTFDLLASSNQQSWPWQVETMLRSRGRPVEVFNAGFPGWTSLENTISLVIRDLDLRPDVVVLFQGINDLQPASHVPFDPQYEHGHADTAVRALGFELPPVRWYNRSLLVQWSRELVLGDIDPWRPMRARASGRELLSEVPKAALETFERNVRCYTAAAAAGGARVVLVTQTVRIRSGLEGPDLAYLGQWIEGLEPSAVGDQLERFNGVLRRLSHDGAAVLVDAAVDVEWRDSDFADPMHFSSAGSERMAAYMSDALEGTVLERPPEVSSSPPRSPRAGRDGGRGPARTGP